MEVRWQAVIAPVPHRYLLSLSLSAEERDGPGHHPRLGGIGGGIGPRLQVTRLSLPFRTLSSFGSQLSFRVCGRERLLIDPHEHPMLLAEPSFNTSAIREK